MLSRPKAHKRPREPPEPSPWFIRESRSCPGIRSGGITPSPWAGHFVMDWLQSREGQERCQVQRPVSMDSSPVGLLSFAAPEMFPLAPMIHRGAQKGDHSTRGMARWGLEGWPFWGAKSRKGALPSFGLSMFCTIVVLGGRREEYSYALASASGGLRGRAESGIGGRG